MNKSLMTWLGQVTTGHGIMILAGALLSVFSGASTWTGAAPFLLAGVVGLFWPENTALQTAAQAAATELMNIINNYQKLPESLRYAVARNQADGLKAARRGLKATVLSGRKVR